MKTYLEPSEISLLENETTNLRDRLLIKLLFHLGCRISEALALKTGLTVSEPNPYLSCWLHPVTLSQPYGRPSSQPPVTGMQSSACPSPTSGLKQNSHPVKTLQSENHVNIGSF